MKRSLRQRIVFITIIPLLLATAAALLVVNDQVGRQSRGRLAEELQVADAVLENILATREEDLRVRAEIVSRDPKFFALLSIPTDERTSDYGPTLLEIVNEFRAATGADLLEVLDPSGHYLAGSSDSDGGHPARTPADAADGDVTVGRSGEKTAGIIVRGASVYQVAATPIMAGGQLVGILHYGNAIDRALAERVRDLAGADVTFALNGSPIAASGDATGPVLRREGRLPHMLDPERATYSLTISLEPEIRFLSRVRWTLAGVGFLFAFLAVGVAQWLGFRITRPIQQLLRASERLEKGDYDAPVEVHTGDELQGLATAFDGMRQSLHHQIETLATLDQMKSDFLDIASHELRTPASVLRGCVDLLVMAPPAELAPGGELADILESLSESSKHLARIVEQITDMSLLDRRQMEIGMQPMDLGNVVSEVVGARRNDCAGRRLELVLDMALSPLPVMADPKRIHQVVENLLLNAIRYTPDGGMIIVRTSREGDQVRCDVEDNGIGIAPEIQDRIFEPLFEGRNIMGHSSGTVEFNSAGLGTGLAISRRIVEAHGGKIEVISAPGAGSLFRISFPWLDAASPMAATRGPVLEGSIA